MPTSSDLASTTTNPHTAAAAAEEQPVVDRLFGRLDNLRAEAVARRDQALRTTATGTPQALAERDAFVALYEHRIRQLQRSEDGLVFGRLDRVGADGQYIGRLGLRDEEHQQLLVDWRAPAAQGSTRPPQPTLPTCGAVVTSRCETAPWSASTTTS